MGKNRVRGKGGGEGGEGEVKGPGGEGWNLKAKAFKFCSLHVWTDL